MTTINLRKFYPWYTQDEFIDVPDEVAEELLAGRRQERTYQRTMRRNKVRSLDAEDGTEEEASLYASVPIETALELMERYCRLCHALNSLPEIQGRRIEAHFILGKSHRQIARDEGVSQNAVTESIDRGLLQMKKVFWRNFKNCLVKGS